MIIKVTAPLEDNHVFFAIEMELQPIRECLLTLWWTLSAAVQRELRFLSNINKQTVD